MGMFFLLHPGWLQDCSDALAALTDLLPLLSFASKGSWKSLLRHAQVCILKGEAELIWAPKKPVGRGYSNHLRETGSHEKHLHPRPYLGVARGEEHPLATPTGFSRANARMELPSRRRPASRRALPSQRALLTVERRSQSIPKPSAQTPGHRGSWIYGTAPRETADVGEHAHLYLYSGGAGCQSGLIRDKFTRAHSVTQGTSLLAYYRPAKYIGRLLHIKATWAYMFKMNFTGRHRDRKRRRACVTNDIQMWKHCKYKHQKAHPSTFCKDNTGERTCCI